MNDKTPIDISLNLPTVTFSVGPYDFFTIDEPLPNWQVIEQVLVCIACKHLHLVFDSPSGRGQATCQCPEGKEGRNFHRLL